MTETPLPVEFDPKTLRDARQAVLADKDAYGQVTTAHPHYDYERDEVVNYTAPSFGPKTTYRVYAAGEVGGSGALIGSLPVKKPGYMHSFGMSERYVVLAENPLVVNPMSVPLSKKAFIDNYRGSRSAARASSSWTATPASVQGTTRPRPSSASTTSTHSSATVSWSST